MQSPIQQALSAQAGILANPAEFGRVMTFRLRADATPEELLKRLAQGFDPAWGVVGLGHPLTEALGRTVPGLRPFAALANGSLRAPATQEALWINLLGSDRGCVFDRSERVRELLESCAEAVDVMDTFLYEGGRDLTGYEDGTENPQEEAAVEAALIPRGEGLAGSSFVAVQRWQHDLARFRSFPREQQDDTIGRRQDTNEEFEEAPETAHVKRTAQESYDPPAFVVRRSHPWAEGTRRGLEFIAYGESLDRFERILRRMLGLEDSTVDALFDFTRPVTGGYYWCPPLKGEALDLSVLFA